MAYLIAILASLGLLSAFMGLTEYESGRGQRFFESRRAHYDKKVERFIFVLTHVDFKAFLLEELTRLGVSIGHFMAYMTLQTVRSVERALTRLVRTLRIHHTVDMTPGESTREFVKTLSDFKDQLKETRPEVPDIV